MKYIVSLHVCLYFCAEWGVKMIMTINQRTADPARLQIKTSR